MERAIRVVSVQRGHDPRRFALLAFGGAGGMHACELARRLEIQTVVVPKHAGVLSALGMLAADVAFDYSHHALTPLDRESFADLNRRFRPLVEKARADLRREGFHAPAQRIARLVDVRYAGQSYELTIPFVSGLRERFDREHERRYGYANPDRPAEAVNLRVAARGLSPKPRLPFSDAHARFKPKPVAARRARFNGRAVRMAYYRWPELEPGAAARGPAVITSGDATVVVPPDFRFTIDGFGNVIAS